jgi:hypothetical protein
MTASAALSGVGGPVAVPQRLGPGRVGFLFALVDPGQRFGEHLIDLAVPRTLVLSGPTTLRQTASGQQVADDCIGKQPAAPRQHQPLGVVDQQPVLHRPFGRGPAFLVEDAQR